MLRYNQAWGWALAHEPAFCTRKRQQGAHAPRLHSSRVRGRSRHQTTSSLEHQLQRVLAIQTLLCLRTVVQTSFKQWGRVRVTLTLPYPSNGVGRRAFTAACSETSAAWRSAAGSGSGAHAPSIADGSLSKDCTKSRSMSSVPPGRMNACKGLPCPALTLTLRMKRIHSKSSYLQRRPASKTDRSHKTLAWSRAA